MVVLLVVGAFILCCLCDGLRYWMLDKEQEQKENVEREEDMCMNCPYNPHRDDEIM